MRASGSGPPATAAASAVIRDINRAARTPRSRRVRKYQDHKRGVYALEISPDGKQVLSAGKSDALHLWDFATGKRIRTLTGHTGFVECVGFAPDGERIVSGSSNWVRSRKGD